MNIQSDILNINKRLRNAFRKFGENSAIYQNIKNTVLQTALQARTNKEGILQLSQSKKALASGNTEYNRLNKTLINNPLFNLTAEQNKRIAELDRIGAEPTQKNVRKISEIARLVDSLNDLYDTVLTGAEKGYLTEDDTNLLDLREILKEHSTAYSKSINEQEGLSRLDIWLKKAKTVYKNVNKSLRKYEEDFYNESENKDLKDLEEYT